jgi:hypothetical protein
LATPITAYLAEDGNLYRSREEAEWSDHALRLQNEIKEFLAKHTVRDADGTIANLIALWDQCRSGGYQAWVNMFRSKTADAAPPDVAAAATVPLALAAPDPEPAVAAPAPVVPAAPTAYRRRVAVVALPHIHHRTIEKEFGSEFKLLLLDYANAMPKLESLRQYHKVIVMTRHAHAKTVQLLRGIGQEPLQLRGDVDELRTVLTDMYVATST